MTEERIPIQKAIEIANGQTGLGRKIGASQQRVRNWLLSGRVPADMCIKIEKETGVPKHELRPDLFDAPVSEPAG